MASPIVLYLNFATTVLNVALTAFQSIKERHFEISCCSGKLCWLNDNISLKTQEKNTAQGTIKEESK